MSKTARTSSPVKKTNRQSPVEIATDALREIFPQTALQQNNYLSKKFKATILLKREDLSPVRSYKIRGAYNFLRKSLKKNPDASHFVCASAGNHSQGFAFACDHFGVNGTVFMPVTTPKQKIDKTRVFGGKRVEIKLVGDIFDQCNTAAMEFAKQHDYTFVPPFDHADIIEGQASIAQEIINQHPNNIDMVIIPVGGGGCASGILKVLQEKSPQTQIILVEPAGAPSLKTSLERGRRTRLKHIDTFVDGAAVAMIGKSNFNALKHLPASSLTLVSENRLCETIIEMLNIEGIVLEPAGAMSVEALRNLPESEIRGKTIVCITSGGNFDFERLPEVKERAMKAAGLKKYYILRMPQRPGALREFLELLGPDDDIARFEYLKKSARNFGSILLGVETSKPKNFDTLTRKMNKAGFEYVDITDDEVVASLVI